MCARVCVCFVMLFQLTFDWSLEIGKIYRVSQDAKQSQSTVAMQGHFKDFAQLRQVGCQVSTRVRAFNFDLFHLNKRVTIAFITPLQLSQKCQVRRAECAANISSGRQGLWAHENRWAKNTLQLHGTIQWEQRWIRHAAASGEVRAVIYLDYSL